MNLNRSIHRSLRAFTLIELILSIGIMAIVMIAINSVFFTSMRLREGVSTALEETLPVQQALGILRRDLQGALPPVENGALSGGFRFGLVSSTSSGRPVEIEFSTTTGAIREDEPWSEVQRVTYELRPSDDRQSPGMDLIRSVTRNVLATITQRPEEQWLMSGVESIQFSCTDGTTWYDTWDASIPDDGGWSSGVAGGGMGGGSSGELQTGQSQSSTSTSWTTSTGATASIASASDMPVAVRVRILLANPDSESGTPRPIEMIVPINSRVRTVIQPVETDTQ